MGTAYEKVMDSRKELVDQIIKMMEEGFHFNQEGWEKGFLSPHNPESGTIYHGGNKLRLMLMAAMQKYNDPRWMTYKQIKKAGYTLKPGQHGVLCEKWIFPEDKVNEKNHGTQQNIKENEKDEGTTSKQNVAVSYFFVFNAQQVKDYPVYVRPFSNPHDNMLQFADDLIGTSECPIYEHEQDRAYYSRQKDHIILPPRQYFKNGEAFVSTLLHEMGHSTGHESRLGRQYGKKFGDENYAREELIAELSTVFSSADLGVQVSEERMQDNSDYLKSWIKALNDDPNELFRVCAYADKATARIVGHYYEKYPEDSYEEIEEVKTAIKENDNSLDNNVKYQYKKGR